MSSKIAVLLAAYNGMKWIDEQIQSILNQKNVTVDIYISVDQSTDGTEHYCHGLAGQHENIYLLHYGERFGGAARNFYRLIRDVDFNTYNFVAFADQDDIWNLDKLFVATNKLKEGCYDCYSSNVMAFWSDGNKRLVSKAQPQTDYDYFFESAGPGCTYVFTQETAIAFKTFVHDNPRSLDVELHDWMIYAFARSNGYKWYIDSYPTMLYRQHDNNQFGANSGWQSIKRRIVMVRSKWYSNEVNKIINVLGKNDIPFIKKCFEGGWYKRIFIVANVGKMRRKMKDRIALMFIALMGGI